MQFITLTSTKARPHCVREHQVKAFILCVTLVEQLMSSRKKGGGRFTCVGVLAIRQRRFRLKLSSLEFCCLSSVKCRLSLFKTVWLWFESLIFVFVRVKKKDELLRKITEIIFNEYFMVEVGKRKKNKIIKAMVVCGAVLESWHLTF